MGYRLAIISYAVGEDYEEEQSGLATSVWGNASYHKDVTNHITGNGVPGRVFSSCFDILPDMPPLPGATRWQQATSFKPTYILHFLNSFPNEDVLYLDADARVQPEADFSVLRYLLEYYGGGFVGAHILPNKSRGMEILTGTILWRNCPQSKELLTKWEALCRANPGVWDQKHFQSLIPPFNDPIACTYPEGRLWRDGLESAIGPQGEMPEWFIPLDSRWCWIDGGKKPDISEKVFGPPHPEFPPLIIHTQASRRYKRS